VHLQTASTPSVSASPPAIGVALKIVLLSMLMGGASIVALGSSGHPIDPIWFRVRYGLVGLPFVTLIVMSFLRAAPSAQRGFPLLLLVWLCFGSTALLSGLIHENVKALTDGAWFLVGVPSLFFYMLPRALGRSISSATAWGLALGHCPYLVCSLAQGPPTVFPYTGVFSNSNQLGATMLSLNCGLLILLNKTILEPPTFARTVKLLSLGGFILLGFVLTIFSNSRTSLLGSFFGLMLSLYPIIPAFRQPKALMRLLLFGIGLASVVVLWGGQALGGLWQSIESGYADKLGSNDAFNGRGPIWQKTFADMQLFGYGSNDYFLDNFDLGGHNSFIDILGQSGLIAFYLIVIVAFMSLYYSYRYFWTQKKVNSDALAPLLINIMFWTTAMAESMFGSLGRGLTIAYLLSLGALLYRPTEHPAQTRPLNQQETVL
jgi:O-Antigen ligase